MESAGDGSGHLAGAGEAQNLAAAGLFSTPHVNLRGVAAEGDYPNLASPSGWPTGGPANGAAAAAFNAALAAEVSQPEQLEELSLDELGGAEAAAGAEPPLLPAAAGEQTAVGGFEFSMPVSAAAAAAAATPCLALAGRLPAARGCDEVDQPDAAADSPDAMDAWSPAAALHDAFTAAAPAAAPAASAVAADAAPASCSGLPPLQLQLPAVHAVGIDLSGPASLLAALLPEGLPAEGWDGRPPSLHGSCPPSLHGSRPASPWGPAPLLPAAASSATIPCSDAGSVCSQAATPAAAALAQLGSLYINEKTGQIMQK